MGLLQNAPRRVRKQVGGRRSNLVKDAKAISERLRFWIGHHAQSRKAFLERSGLKETTLKRWLKRDGVSGLDTASLISLARKEQISLNWLLLGEGAEGLRLTRSEDALEADVAAYISSAAAVRAGVTSQFAASVVAEYGAEHHILNEAAEVLSKEVKRQAEAERKARQRERERRSAAIGGRDNFIVMVKGRKQISPDFIQDAVLEKIRRDERQKAADEARTTRPPPDPPVPVRRDGRIILSAKV